MPWSALTRGFRSYAELVRAPGVGWVVVWGLLARLPMGMTPLGLVFMVRGTGGSYAAAGIVSAAYAVAVAVAAPVSGRLVDRGRPGSVLRIYAIVCPGVLCALLLLAWAGAPVAVLTVAALLAGVTFPPIGPTVRKLWPRLVAREEQRQTAYALEATLQELIFVTGPLVVGALVALFGWGAGIAGSAVVALAGVLGFALTGGVRAAPPPEPGTHAGRHLLAALGPPTVRRVIAFSVGYGLAFGAVEVAMPAFAEDHGGRALGSLALAAWSAGSLAGGLLAGAVAIQHPHRRLRVVSTAFAAVLVLPLVAGSIGAMAAVMFLAGLPIAPSFAITYGLVERTAIPGSHAEVFGWLSTATVAGIAAGSAAGGSLITHVSTDASIGLGICGAAAAAAVAWAGWPRPASAELT